MSRFHPKYFALETGLLQKFVNGRYPDLKFDALVLPEDGLHLEVDANGRHEGRGERVVRVPEVNECYDFHQFSEGKTLYYIFDIKKIISFKTANYYYGDQWCRSLQFLLREGM
jgi:hypothetical protein